MAKGIQMMRENAEKRGKTLDDAIRDLGSWSPPLFWDLSPTAKAERFRVVRLFATFLAQKLIKNGREPTDTNVEALAIELEEELKTEDWIEKDETLHSLALEFLSNLATLDPDNFRGSNVPENPAWTSLHWSQKQDGPPPDERPEALRTVREYQNHLLGWLRGVKVEHEREKMLNRVGRKLSKHFDQEIKYELPSWYTQRYQPSPPLPRQQASSSGQTAVQQASSSGEVKNELFSVKKEAVDGSSEAVEGQGKPAAVKHEAVSVKQEQE